VEHQLHRTVGVTPVNLTPEGQTVKRGDGHRLIVHGPEFFDPGHHGIPVGFINRTFGNGVFLGEGLVGRVKCMLKAVSGDEIPHQQNQGGDDKKRE
jgi:hypothetical protein